MDFIFADDARQKNPSRKGMGPLVAIGGVHVSGDKVGLLEKAINDLCARTGFPSGQQFKWSPGKKDTFMKTKLIGEARVTFYQELCELGIQNGSSACVVIEDSRRRTALSGSESHEIDVTSLFLERANWTFSREITDGVVVVATPGGGTKAQEKFILHSITLLEKGTRYSKFNRIPLPILTSKARHVRLLQFADIVTSCTTARVAGESTYSPEIFEFLKPMFRKDMSRIGGVGVKLHPDFVYANLYHWLLGDTHWVKHNTGVPLPRPGRPYYDAPDDVSNTTGTLKS
ncbi:MAG: hypothetical protein HWN69_06440 [Desulfobacterales bacterium]|nr:hypothetical protein [Desulfobacterales bacterium]